MLTLSAYALLFVLGLLLFVGGLKFGVDTAGLLGTAIMVFVVLRFRIAYLKRQGG